MSTTLSSPGAHADVPTRTAVMAQSSGENFPVASRLLSARQRGHLLAIYGFARLVDDVGDEAPGDRLALLNSIEDDLNRVYAGQATRHPVLAALAPSVADCGLPAEAFRRLIAANRRDQSVTRYQTFEELLAYCQLSAAPVGELVLHVFRAASAARIALSDRICAGLQVTEHLQDVGEDYARGRVYLPLEDLTRFGVGEPELGAEAVSSALRGLLAFETARAWELLKQGAPLAGTLSLRPRLAVAGFVGGGRAALDALERGGYEVLASRPRPSRRRFTSSWIRVVVGH